MQSRQPFFNKDIPLQVIKSSEMDSTKISTQISSTNSAIFMTVNEKLKPEIKHDYRDSKMNKKSHWSHYTNKNPKQLQDAENLNQISILNSQFETSHGKLRQIMLKNFKWSLIFLIICTFLCLLIYIILNFKEVLSVAKSVYPSSIEENGLSNIKPLESLIGSEVHIINRDVKGNILYGSTTLVRPVIIPQLAKSDFMKHTQFSEEFQNASLIDNTNDLKSHSKNRSEIISLLGFTSGHQNNFGIPIEEDERILKLLSKNQHYMSKETETTIMVSKTESTIIVSPTLPLMSQAQESSTRSELLEETLCNSTSLFICRGVLQYDLTAPTDMHLLFTSLDLNSVQELFSSNCSSRAAEFVCSIMEPECRPMQKSLPPCKRLCKSISESCTSLIIASEILTYLFDCDKYPDSSNVSICEDLTRRTECNENEFKCRDFSCIPRKWLCDNIKDCEDGDDEVNCLTCNTKEFRCKSNDMCLLDKYRCDLKEDCPDGSDEQDCDAELENTQVSPVPGPISFSGLTKGMFTDRDIFNAVFNDDRLPAESEFKESVIYNDTTVTIINQSGLSQSSSTSKNPEKEEIKVSIDVEQNQNVEEKDRSGIKDKTICLDDQLRCVSGKCITVSQLCDRVVDCPKGEDEIMCGYDVKQPRQ